MFHKFSFSNDFCSIAPEPIVTIISIRPPWAEGINVCSNGVGLLTKMATMHVYWEKKKTLRKSSSPYQETWNFETSYKYL